METKHTPGPWLLDGRLVYSLYQTGWDKGNPIMSNRFWAHIAVDHGVKLEEAEANAKLIVAAPDLLEACIEAKNLLRAELYEPYRTTFWNLVRAINKATE